ncbi:MAG: AAA-like domain-containing protein [Victivallales bacterium]|nr:AAA-like domain-containing protein [Victivallales bacterium]
MKRFNTTGTCFPNKHYMVDLTERVAAIRAMVDNGDYFCINRGRQYGKTTTLEALANALQQDYVVFSISFEVVGDDAFLSEKTLAKAFIDSLGRQVKFNLVKQLTDKLTDVIGKLVSVPLENMSLPVLDELISDLCLAGEKPVVVIIDEVDQASNYESFIKFLGLLRAKYLNREKMPTFHSVILAGVYDIRNLKLKIRKDEEHSYNSPWNIAANFDIPMELSKNGIAGMLADYEADHSTGMDIDAMAKLLSDYTGGYPFLVSRLCQIMDEKLQKTEGFGSLSECWTKDGFLSALKVLLDERNTLFDDMIKKINDFPELRQLLHDTLCTGRRISFSQDDKPQNLALMFNFIRNDGGKVAVANRIFEIRLYNLFILEESRRNPELNSAGSVERSLYVKNGRLDMDTVMERFAVHYADLFGHRHGAFAEADARQCFLMFLVPIINGTGHYYVEAQTRDERRMDVVVDYRGDQFIVELKIWRGEAYREHGIEQLCDYLESMHMKKGYLLTFNLADGKQPGHHVTNVGDKTILETVV